MYDQYLIGQKNRQVVYLPSHLLSSIGGWRQTLKIMTYKKMNIIASITGIWLKEFDNQPGIIVNKRELAFNLFVIMHFCTNALDICYRIYGNVVEVNTSPGMQEIFELNYPITIANLPKTMRAANT